MRMLFSSRLLQTIFILVLLSSHSDNACSQDESLPEEFVKTLSRAREDMLSENEQRRVGAAILLGKYTFTQSQQLLFTALDDASPAVRRAAVVSLREQAKFSNIADTEKFLSKLGDKDIEVRRAVSSMVGYLGSQLAQLSRAAHPSGQGYTLPPDLKKIVMTTFSDQDDIVRLNIVRSYFRLNLVLTPDMVVTLLTDNHPEIVIATLQILGTVSLTDNIMEQIERLSESENHHTRVALVENLINSQDQRIVRLLMRLTDSDQPYFRFIHYILKVRHGAEVTKDEIKEITELLSTFKKSTDLLDKLIKEAHLFQSESVNLALIHHTLLKFRLSGWDILLKKEISGIDNTLLLKGLNDPSSRVRQTVFNFLLQSPEQVPGKLIESMIASKIPEVRIGAAELLIRMPVAPAPEHILPLLVDEHPQVRASSLRVMVKHRLVNWQKILKRSLHDRDFSVQKQSVTQLIGIGQEGIGIIQSYRQENSQTALAKYISVEFVRRKIQPVPDAGLPASATQ